MVPTSGGSEETKGASESAEELADLKIQRSTPPLHLTVSAQLHLEALAIGLSKVGKFRLMNCSAFARDCLDQRPSSWNRDRYLWFY